MRDFPGFEHVYFLKDPLSKRPLRGEIDKNMDTFAVTRGDAGVSAPVQVSWYMGGSMPSDFVWTGNVGAVIVHRRVVRLLREEGFTGWRSYVVSVIDKGGDYHPEYEGLVILGRCASVDLSRSVVVLSQYPAGWFPHLLGYYFNEETWDGTDLFMETADSLGKRTAHVFVTERVRFAFERAKVKNVRFERLTDHSVRSSVYEIGSSHLLPRDFSQQVSAAYRRAGIPPPDYGRDG